MISMYTLLMVFFGLPLCSAHVLYISDTKCITSFEAEEPMATQA